MVRARTLAEFDRCSSDKNIVRIWFFFYRGACVSFGSPVPPTNRVFNASCTQLGKGCRNQFFPFFSQRMLDMFYDTGTSVTSTTIKNRGFVDRRGDSSTNSRTARLSCTVDGAPLVLRHIVSVQPEIERVGGEGDMPTATWCTTLY